MEELEPVEADFLVPIQGREARPMNFKHNRSSIGYYRDTITT